MKWTAIIWLIGSIHVELIKCCADVCKLCQCSGKNITCADVTFATKAFKCGFTYFKVSTRKPVVVPWRQIQLPDRSNGIIITLDLYEELLSCSSCDNVWLLQWETIKTRTLQALRQCINCPAQTASALLHLPIVRLRPDLQHCNSKQRQSLLQKCGIYNKTQNVIRMTEVKNSAIAYQCSVIEPPIRNNSRGMMTCLKGRYQTIPLLAPSASINPVLATKFRNDDRSCATEISLIRNATMTVMQSGFFGCSVDRGYLPAVQWRFVAFDGKPHFSNWSVNATDQDTSVEAEIVSSGPFSVHLLFSRLITDAALGGEPVDEESVDAEQILYDIRPKPASSSGGGPLLFAMNVVDNPFSISKGGLKTPLKGIVRKQAVLKFFNLANTCDTIGQYYLLAYNDHGVSLKTFSIVKTPYGHCNKITDTFQVLHVVRANFRQFQNSVWDNKTLDYATDEAEGNLRIDDLQFEKYPEEREKSKADATVIILLSALLVVAGIAMATCMVVKIRENLRVSKNIATAKDGTELRPLVTENNAYLEWIHQLEEETDIPVIAAEELEVVRLLGQGAFGHVHLVKRKSPFKFAPPDCCLLLAMKQLKPSYVNMEKLGDLEREAMLLNQLRHPNIVTFYGVTLVHDSFALLFEYMDGGDLATHLRDRSSEADGDKSPMTYSEMLRVSIQVASGLRYLHERHLVHRDVAARNCLISHDLIVKLSDFGMARDVYVTDYYKMNSHTLVPLRWLPPESIIYRKFTIESDIWSFGILLWEIFSGGMVPWYMYTNTELPLFCITACSRTI